MSRLGGGVSSAVREAVPAHVRLFASTLAGDRSPVIAENFSPREIAAMQALIAQNETSPFYKRGAVTYGDYIQRSAAVPTDSRQGDARAHVGPFYGGFDFHNPDLNAVGNSVGQFRYKRMPDGSIVIDDSYDWDSGRPDGGQATGRPSLRGALRGAINTGSLEQLGAYAVPDAQRGRPMHIVLPPVRMTAR